MRRSSPASIVGASLLLLLASDCAAAPSTTSSALRRDETKTDVEVTLADAGTEECDDSYECEFFHVDKDADKTYIFNLNGLCGLKDYTVKKDKSTSGSFSFNICGLSNNYCLPSSNPYIPYTNGVAIQYLGDPPANPGQCALPGSTKTKDCTADCEVLGHGQPVFELIDSSNPLTGGLRILHDSELASDRDTHECYDPALRSFVGRSITYKLMCDESVPLAEPVQVEEAPVCQYTITLKTSKACGEEFEHPSPNPSSNGDSEGPADDSHAGLRAGMFFLGLGLAVGGAAGFWWYRNKRGGSGYLTFGGASKTSAPSAASSGPSYSTGTGGIGSSL